MPKKKLKVGVIGTGAIAKEMHLPNWKELEEEGRVELVGVCDVFGDRAKEAAAEFGAQKSYKSFSAMLKNDDYDIIDICTHNKHHCRGTLAALEAGANVLVEKPMAMNVREAKSMIAAATKAKKKLMVAQHMRFMPKHEVLKSFIDSGELGEVYTARAFWLRRRGIPGWGKFHIKKESLGGPLIDIGVHMMDLAYWLMGCPKPVSASGKVYRMFGDRKDLINKWGVPYKLEEFDVEDLAMAFVRFENGLTMTVDVSWAANISEDEGHSVRILGDKAGISTNPAQVFGAQHGALTSTSLDWVEEDKPHRREIRHFTECLEKKLPVRVQPEESLNIQKIIEAIYESSRRNKEIAIR